jgi:hypothetical protein
MVPNKNSAVKIIMFFPSTISFPFHPSSRFSEITIVEGIPATWVTRLVWILEIPSLLPFTVFPETAGGPPRRCTVKLNRIQMQPGMSLNQFLTEHGNEHQCEAVLEQSRWPQGFQCPECMAMDHCSYLRGRVPSMSITDDADRRAIFHSTKLPLTTRFQAMYFLSQNKNSYSGVFSLVN